MCTVQQHKQYSGSFVILLQYTVNLPLREHDQHCSIDRLMRYQSDRLRLMLTFPYLCDATEGGTGMPQSLYFHVLLLLTLQHGNINVPKIQTMTRLYL